MPGLLPLFQYHTLRRKRRIWPVIMRQRLSSLRVQDKVAKTHTGVRTEFSKLAHREPRIDRCFLSFLAQAYELKAVADYGVGPITRISSDDAKAAIEIAGRFIACISELLNQPHTAP